MGFDLQSNVLLLAHGGPLNGSQRQTLYLAENLSRHGYQPHVVIDSGGAALESLRAADVACTILPLSGWRTLKGFIRRPFELRHLRRVMSDVRPVLVHAADVYKCGYAVEAAHSAKVPALVHVRGPLNSRDVSKHQLERADALVAIASRHADVLYAAGISPERIRVVDDSVDCEKFCPALRRENAFRREFSVQHTWTVGMVGRVEDFKKTRSFVQLAGHVLRTGVNAKFFVIGEMQDSEYAEQVRADAWALGCGDGLIFTGRRTDIENVLAGLDILVTLSGGSVMFEAQAAGTPVLSVSESGAFSVHTRDGDTAVCMRSADMRAVAEVLVHLLRDEQKRITLTARARSYVESHLSVTAMVEETVRIYDSLLGVVR